MKQAVGDAMQEVFKAGTIQRKDVFVTTNNHRPERVKPAFEASRQRLRLDYVDCYLVHTPFAVLAADRREPGHVGQTEPIRNAAAALAGYGSDLPLKMPV